MTTRSKRATWVCFGLVVICVLTALSLKVLNDRHLALARQIQIGDSMAKVRSLLGSPTTTYLGVFGNPSWSYGSRIDFCSKFPWLNIHLFGPDTSDLAFFFDVSSNVVRIQLPSR
jgi:SmpA / OmlA family